MTTEEINSRVATLCGWTEYHSEHRNETRWREPNSEHNWLQPPDYTNSLDLCRSFESTITSTADRVKWLNTMREIVSRRCPKNKIGAPLVSDFDIAMSTAMERCECWLKMKGRWENL